MERSIKALGTFGFQVSRRGADRFVPAIGRTLERLRPLLGDSELSERMQPYLELAATQLA